jgi:hypothetical protein
MKGTVQEMKIPLVAEIILVEVTALEEGRIRNLRSL